MRAAMRGAARTSARTPRRAVVCSLAVLLALPGCRESPTDGFERFYEALAAGDAEAAAVRLSSRARAQIVKDNAALGLTPAGALAASFPKSTVRSVRLLSSGEERALVEVTDALGSSTRVAMRREDGLWRVDIDGDAP